MNKRLWSALAAGAVIGAAGIAAYAIVSPGGEEEVVQQVETPTGSATATPAPSLPTVTTPPLPTVPPIPEDWLTYVDPGGFFTARYPPNWFERNGAFYSRDPETFTGPPSLDPETIKVEFGNNPAIGSETCGGTISVDADTGEEIGPHDGATPAILGGVPAWQMVTRQADSPNIDPLTKIHRISVIHSGQCFLATAYFIQQDPDDAIFPRIADSLRFLGAQQ